MKRPGSTAWGQESLQLGCIQGSKIQDFPTESNVRTDSQPSLGRILTDLSKNGTVAAKQVVRLGIEIGVLAPLSMFAEISVG
jgi:hypothetical protein